MPRFERYTARRGRSAEPRIFPRTRRWRLRRASRTERELMTNRPAPAPAEPAPPSGAGSIHEPRPHWSLRQAYGSCALPDLPADVLALVADALALVGLGRAHLPDLGGGLPDGLLVDAAHDHLGGRRHLELDP